MRALLSILIVAALTLTTPAVAVADTYVIADAVGDGKAADGSTAGDSKLDITSVRLKNNPNAIRVKLRVAEVARGEVRLYFQLRPHRRFRVISRFREGRGIVANFLYDNHNAYQDGRSCLGLTGSWDLDADTIKLRIPAKCVKGGDYDELRFLVEAQEQGSSDRAPEGHDADGRHSPWIGRG